VRCCLIISHDSWGVCALTHHQTMYWALFTMESAVTDAGAVVVGDGRLANRVAVYSMHSSALRCGHFTSASQHWTTVLDQGDHRFRFFGPFQCQSSK
jgi:hypothetical protein